MSGGGFGKLFLHGLNGGNSQFATYDFIQDRQIHLLSKQQKSI